MNSTYPNLYSLQGLVHSCDHISNNIHSSQPRGATDESWNKPYERRELSPFAQTVVELEAEFYAQFPEAKRAYLEQRSHQAALQGLQPDISGFEYYGESTLRLAPNYAEPVYFPSPESPIRSIPKPPPLHRLHSDHAPSLEDPRCTTIATLPSQPYGWSEQLEIGYAAPQNIVDLRPLSLPPPPTPPPSPVITIQNHQLTRFPSQTVASPTMRKGVDIYPLSAALSNPVPRTDVETIQFTGDWSSDVETIQFTGDWLLDVRAMNDLSIRTLAPHNLQEPDLTIADHPVTNPPPTFRHHQIRRLRKTARAQPHASTKGKLRSSSLPRRRRSTLSKAMPKAATVGASSDKTKESPDSLITSVPSKRNKVACHYCRKRKIACGVPPEGSVDMTCDQCVQRNQECEYPQESYRGLKKKKQVGDLERKATIVATADLHDSDADAEGEDELT